MIFEVQFRTGAQNTFAIALSRLLLEEEINSLKFVHPCVEFDDDFSGIQTLEELPVDEILSAASQAQQSDASSQLSNIW